MKIVYLGSGQFGLECLNALNISEHDLRFIVTQPPNPAGRGRKPQPTPVAHWANVHSIPFIEVGNVNAPEVVEKIAGFEPDLIVVIAFGQKIGHELTNLPPKGSINVHASLLPKYRGAAPINWAIINGETTTGISIITLSEKMDAGKVLAQSQTAIAADETAGRLHDRLAKIAAPLLLKTIDQIASGTAVYTEQDHDKATLAPKLKKSDGYLDFTEPAEVLARKIRGLWPWPGASANYVRLWRSGKPVRVTIAMAEYIEPQRVQRKIFSDLGMPSRESTKQSEFSVDSVSSVAKQKMAGTLDENLNVVCGSGSLTIKKIKPAGSALMDFNDFVNGRQTRPGDSFVKIDEW